MFYYKTIKISILTNYLKVIIFKDLNKFAFYDIEYLYVYMQIANNVIRLSVCILDKVDFNRELRTRFWSHKILFT